MSNKREIVVAASALSMLLVPTADAQDKGERKGVAGYVRGNVRAIPTNGGRAIRVRVGDAVFENQRIVTDRRSRMQLMMVDKSSITIGPNSDLTIDQYKFKKEEPGVGQMVLSSAKGLFRFVGGLLSKRNPVQVRTPTATIGIRGAIVYLEFTPAGMQMVFFYGNEATVTPNDGGVTESVTSPGYSITINNDGSTEKKQLSAAQVAALAATLEGSADGDVTASSATLGIGPTVFEVDLDAPNLDLSELERVLRVDDADFDSIRQVLDQLKASVAGSGGGMAIPSAN
jgi:trimeric autotransporter adhesin